MGMHCLVMLSGGIDSTVMLSEAMKRWPGRVASMTTDSKPREVEAARVITARLNVPHIIVSNLDRARGFLGALEVEPRGMLSEPRLGPDRMVPDICSIADSIFYATLFGAKEGICGKRFTAKLPHLPMLTTLEKHGGFQLGCGIWA